jgi:hypothetical protein
MWDVRPDACLVPDGTGHRHLRVSCTAIHFKNNAWLNYVGAEVSVGLTYHFDGIVRCYHRSHGIDLFQPNAVEGSTLGFGLLSKF